MYDAIPLIAAIIFAIVAVIVLVAQNMLLKRQIFENGKERTAEVALTVYTIMDALLPRLDEVRALPDNFDEWKDNEEKMSLAWRVTAELDRVAQLTALEVIEEDYIVELYGAIYREAWTKLSNYVLFYKERFGGHHREHFESLARQCFSYDKDFVYSPDVKVLPVKVLPMKM